MLQFISFSIIFGGLMFIWTFVYLNRSHDKKNQSFLYFLTVIILWIVLSVSNRFNDTSVFSIVVKTIYWYSMLTMSLFFLNFVYRMTNRNQDAVYFILVIVVILTIASRYLFPMDYKNPTFWRLSHPIVAPLMSTIFSLPAVYALYLLLMDYIRTKDMRVKAQYMNVFIGTGFALIISVLSEYVLPTLFNINLNLSLMYYAYFVFVLFIFISIMRHRLLNIQSDYIYRRLFLNSNEGIIIVNRNARIININNLAKQILGDGKINAGDVLTNFIKEYSFEPDYTQQEMEIDANEKARYIKITQHAIDTEHKGSAKLVVISDISEAKRSLQREKDILVEKSNIDQLTEVYNKQFFLEKYCNEKHLETDMSLLFVDVDGFKKINDEHGHLFGDRVLAHVASRIKCNVRKDTEIIRFGGDEFIILLTDAAITQACAVAERIRCAVGEASFYEGSGLVRVTVSIGVMHGTASVKELLTKADMAMYRSKGKGKNTVTIYSENEGGVSVCP